MQTGIITEQGDLGLGFSPITAEEQKVLDEAAKRADEDKEEENNR